MRYRIRCAGRRERLHTGHKLRAIFGKGAATGRSLIGSAVWAPVFGLWGAAADQDAGTGACAEAFCRYMAASARSRSSFTVSGDVNWATPTEAVRLSLTGPATPSTT